MTIKTVAAPKFVSSILKKNGRHMFHVKAVEKYGILEVLSGLIAGSQPSATAGYPYSLEVEKRLRAEIASVSSEEIDLDKLDYPEYKTELNGYCNPTLVNLYLYALDCGLKEDLYLRIFPTTVEVSTKEPREVKPTTARVAHRKDPIKRNLVPEPRSGFDWVWINTPAIRTIDNLLSYEHFKTEEVVTEFIPGQYFKLVVGAEKYILVRGVKGCVALSERGTRMQLDVNGCNVRDSNWNNPDLVAKIHERVLKGLSVELLINVADLRLTGDAVNDAIVHRVLENVLQSEE